MIALLPLSGKKFQNFRSWPMDYIEQEKDREKGERRQASETKREKGGQRTRARDKKERSHFLLEEKKVNENAYDVFSIKRFLEGLRCSRAKQRQRNVQKKCAARAKLFFC